MEVEVSVTVKVGSAKECQDLSTESQTLVTNTDKPHHLYHPNKQTSTPGTHKRSKSQSSEIGRSSKLGGSPYQPSSLDSTLHQPQPKKERQPGAELDACDGNLYDDCYSSSKLRASPMNQTTRASTPPPRLGSSKSLRDLLTDLLGKPAAVELLKRKKILDEQDRESLVSDAKLSEAAGGQSERSRDHEPDENLSASVFSVDIEHKNTIDIRRSHMVSGHSCTNTKASRKDKDASLLRGQEWIDSILELDGSKPVTRPRSELYPVENRESALKIFKSLPNLEGSGNGPTIDAILARSQSLDRKLNSSECKLSDLDTESLISRCESLDRRLTKAEKELHDVKCTVLDLWGISDDTAGQPRAINEQDILRGSVQVLGSSDEDTFYIFGRRPYEGYSPLDLGSSGGSHGVFLESVSNLSNPCSIDVDGETIQYTIHKKFNSIGSLPSASETEDTKQCEGLLGDANSQGSTNLNNLETNHRNSESKPVQAEPPVDSYSVPNIPAVLKLTASEVENMCSRGEHGFSSNETWGADDQGYYRQSSMQSETFHQQGRTSIQRALNALVHEDAKFMTDALERLSLRGSIRRPRSHSASQTKPKRSRSMPREIKKEISPCRESEGNKHPYPYNQHINASVQYLPRESPTVSRKHNLSGDYCIITSINEPEISQKQGHYQQVPDTSARPTRPISPNVIIRNPERATKRNKNRTKSAGHLGSFDEQLFHSRIDALIGSEMECQENTQWNSSEKRPQVWNESNRAANGVVNIEPLYMDGDCPVNFLYDREQFPSTHTYASIISPGITIYPKYNHDSIGASYSSFAVMEKPDADINIYGEEVYVPKVTREWGSSMVQPTEVTYSNKNIARVKNKAQRYESYPSFENETLHVFPKAKTVSHWANESFHRNSDNSPKVRGVPKHWANESFQRNSNNSSKMRGVPQHWANENVYRNSEASPKQRRVPQHWANESFQRNSDTSGYFSDPEMHQTSNPEGVNDIYRKMNCGRWVNNDSDMNRSYYSDGVPHYWGAPKSPEKVKIVYRNPNTCMNQSNRPGNTPNNTFVHRRNDPLSRSSRDDGPWKGRHSASKNGQHPNNPIGFKPVITEHRKPRQEPLQKLTSTNDARGFSHADNALKRYPKRKVKPFAFGRIWEMC